MTRSCWQSTTGRPLELRSDVAIVGAGIAGLSLAYWLKTLAPKLRITVLDAGDIGEGASGRNAGFNTAGSTSYLAQLHAKYGSAEAERYWGFKQESLRLMREHLFSRFTVQQTFAGSTTLYRDPRLLDEHHEVLAQLRAANVKRADLLELEAQGLKNFAGGLAFTHEGSLHSLDLLRSLRDFLRDQGVIFELHQAAAWGEAVGESVKLILSRGELVADHVFLALNGYAGQFHASLSKWVEPKRAQMLSLDFSHRRLMGNFYDPPHKVYFRQNPQTGELLVGGMRLLEEATENSDFDKVTPVIQAALASYACEVFGENLQVRARWAGVMGFTPEERPYIRPVDFLPHTTFVGGFSGHGMGLAFGVAREAILRYLGQSLDTRTAL